MTEDEKDRLIAQLQQRVRELEVEVVLLEAELEDGGCLRLRGKP